MRGDVKTHRLREAGPQDQVALCARYHGGVTDCCTIVWCCLTAGVSSHWSAGLRCLVSCALPTEASAAHVLDGKQLGGPPRILHPPQAKAARRSWWSSRRSCARAGSYATSWTGSGTRRVVSRGLDSPVFPPPTQVVACPLQQVEDVLDRRSARRRRPAARHVFDVNRALCVWRAT